MMELRRELHWTGSSRMLKSLHENHNSGRQGLGYNELVKRRRWKDDANDGKIGHTLMFGKESNQEVLENPGGQEGTISKPCSLRMMHEEQSIGRTGQDNIDKERYFPF
ncbi:hypothetical protein HAX54_004647 [Datura stramonium]|uniref:Uncharacterized protein n=1 Tax=Datura stramonium TaxID=4076 RepID=A0ABS8T827_DATST|nr:hypothetical protein [Datura stramonium]